MVAILYSKLYNVWYYHLYELGEVEYETSKGFYTIDECEADIPKGKGYILSSFDEIIQEIVREKARRVKHEMENNLL